MTTLIFHSPPSETHLTPPGHPEQLARYAAVQAGLNGFDLVHRDAPMADDADILRGHPARYLAKLRAASPAIGWVPLDLDTYLSPGSLTAAVHAVGGACAAVDAVLAGEATNAFLAARPPGHHAEAETAMGFCIFGTVAIAALRALHHHNLRRIAVVDFDVHHGNGTQDLLWNEPRALFCSSHQMPLYPGTGSPAETGAHGQVLNVPLSGHTGSGPMRAAYESLIFPRIAAWKPDLILISAGFDAHQADPLAGLDWQTEDYAWLTQRICDLAGSLCAGRVVSCLEGGYDLPALTASVSAHVGVLQERGR